MSAAGCGHYRVEAGVRPRRKRGCLMPKGDVETFHDNNMWGIQIEGEGPTGDFFEKKEAAVEAGRDLARERGVEHIVRNLDGTIGERSSYGNDPRNVKG